MTPLHTSWSPPSVRVRPLVALALALLLVGCGRIDELESQLSSLRTEAQEMSDRISELEAQVEEFKEKLESAQQAMAQVDSDLDDVERKIIFLEQEDKFALESAVDDLRVSVDAAISELE